MDEQVARQIVQEEIARLRTRSYEALRDEFLNRPLAKEITGPDGKWYQMEVEALWDDRPGGDLRVFVNVDDGRGWRAFFPLGEDFIISPTGQFVGE